MGGTRTWRPARGAGPKVCRLTAGGDSLERTRLWSRLMSTPADPGAPRAPVKKRGNNPMRRPAERISEQRKVRQHQCICIDAGADRRPAERQPIAGMLDDDIERIEDALKGVFDRPVAQHL